MAQFQARINDKDVLIKRNQNQANTVNPIYAKTSRVCPPFCIQPIKLAEGVETIGELEIIGYLDNIIDVSGHELEPNYEDIFISSNEWSDESVFE